MNNKILLYFQEGNKTYPSLYLGLSDAVYVGGLSFAMKLYIHNNS